MTFASDLRTFALKADRLTLDVLNDSATEVHRSIQTGSAATGAPGQPVNTGTLRASWLLSSPSPAVREITTNIAYAPAIEDGVGRFGPMQLRSTVGGFHSVKLTIAGFPKIVEMVTRRMNGLTGGHA